MVSLLGESEGREMGQLGGERERRHDSQRPRGGPEGDESHQMSNKSKVKECLCV